MSSTHFQNLASKRQVLQVEPTAPQEGEFYYDNSLNQLKVYVVKGGAGLDYTGWVFAELTTTTSTSSSTTTTSTSTTTTSTSSSTSTSTSTSTTTSTTTTL